jgi:hypothetical protein
LRRQQDQTLFGVRVTLHPESAADVRPDDAQFGFGDPEYGLRQRFAYAVGILRAGVQDKASVGRIVLPDGPAWLH